MSFLAWCGAFIIGFAITGAIVFVVALLNPKPDDSEIEGREWWV